MTVDRVADLERKVGLLQCQLTEVAQDRQVPDVLIRDRVAALERFMLALAPLCAPLLASLESDGELSLSDTQRAEIAFWGRFTGNVRLEDR